jgi:hypothetical protein
MQYCFDKMDSIPPISFYKLFNGQLSFVPRSEIEDADIAILEPMLTPGRHRLPSTNAYDVETTIAGNTLIATIHGPDHPFIRVYVVVDVQGLALAIPPPRVLDLALPACIVHHLVDQPSDPSVGWMRDLEITLAWAWVEVQAISHSQL